MQSIAELLGYTPIDIHSHLDHGVPGDYSTVVKPETQHTHTMSPDKLRKKYETVGIGSSCFSTYASVSDCARIPEENRFLHQFVQDTDWAYQWVVVHPLQPETFRQAEEMLKCKKAVGIKLHPKNHGYDILEQGDKLFSFAHELGAVVQMHPMANPHMPAFADKYPNMKLIIAHLGSNTFIDAVETAKHGNIYVDTSGSASVKNHILEHAVSRIGATHILFGTDTYSPAFQLARIAWADISEADKKRILLDNALELFPKLNK